MSVFARPTEPVENRLLAALPPDEYERLLPSLQQVSFSLGEVVYEFGWTAWITSFSQLLQSSLYSTPWKTARAPKWV